MGASCAGTSPADEHVGRTSTRVALLDEQAVRLHAGDLGRDARLDDGPWKRALDGRVNIARAERLTAREGRRDVIAHRLVARPLGRCLAGGVPPAVAPVG